jgi:hypothetical protein
MQLSGFALMLFLQGLIFLVFRSGFARLSRPWGWGVGSKPSDPLLKLLVVVIASGEIVMAILWPLGVFDQQIKRIPATWPQGDLSYALAAMLSFLGIATLLWTRGLVRAALEESDRIPGVPPTKTAYTCVAVGLSSVCFAIAILAFGGILVLNI